MIPTSRTLAAWHAFTDAMGASRSLSTFAAFKEAVGPLAEEAERLPYVHGDSRVDRWQVEIGLAAAPPNGSPPEGFEPLAAWHFAADGGDYTVWERPLRACEVAR